MSFSRGLHRKIDTDLLDRIDAGGRPEKRKIAKTSNDPRPAGSYRGARRNEARISKKPMLRYDEIRNINAMRKQRLQRKDQRQ